MLYFNLFLLELNRQVIFFSLFIYCQAGDESERDDASDHSQVSFVESRHSSESAANELNEDNALQHNNLHQVSKYIVQSMLNLNSNIFYVITNLLL